MKCYFTLTLNLKDLVDIFGPGYMRLLQSRYIFYIYIFFFFNCSQTTLRVCFFFGFWHLQLLQSRYDHVERVGSTLKQMTVGLSCVRTSILHGLCWSGAGAGYKSQICYMKVNQLSARVCVCVFAHRKRGHSCLQSVLSLALCWMLRSEWCFPRDMFMLMCTYVRLRTEDCGRLIMIIHN